MAQSDEQNQDDVVDETEEVVEVTEEEGSELSSTQKHKQLREKLRTAEAEKRDLLEQLQRVKADFLNTRKRLEEQQQSAIARSEDRFVAALLPLADSFTMARKDTAAWEAIDEAWRKGVEGIQAQLERILTEHGVKAINPLGEPFDPTRHEAVGTTASDSDAETVVEVVQLGYERNGTVLRPAKVIISSS